MNNKDKLRFKMWQKQHPNFMTPDVEELQTKGDKFFELSSGSKMFSNNYNDRMYGVSVLKKKGLKFETVPDLGKPFDDKKKAKAYMKKLMEGKF